jgi:hypothetical protein
LDTRRARGIHPDVARIAGRLPDQETRARGGRPAPGCCGARPAAGGNGACPPRAGGSVPLRRRRVFEHVEFVRIVELFRIEQFVLVEFVLVVEFVRIVVGFIVQLGRLT